MGGEGFFSFKNNDTTNSGFLPSIADSYYLFTLALTLVVLNIWQGIAFQGLPLEQLGCRPLGSGLWGYLWHGSLKNLLSSSSSMPITQTGVWGYDPIQGAWAPSLRVRWHVASVLVIWGYFWNVIQDFTLNKMPEYLSFTMFLATGAAVTTVYMLLHWMAYTFLPGVSMPGGPRPHRIQRKPQWPATKNLKSFSKDFNFRHASAEKSHKISLERFKDTNAQLFGEPAGRDIWYIPEKTDATTDEENKSNIIDSKVDDETILKLACGGRDNDVFSAATNPNSADIPLRRQLIHEYLNEHAINNNNSNNSVTNPLSSEKSSTIEDALRLGVKFYSMLQTKDGHWAGDYGGPHFLLPGLIVVWYAMGQPDLMINKIERKAMTHYLVVHQQIDGGWGTHIESPSTMFGTTLCYVALRLLGMSADDSVAVKGRSFIRENGGALYTSSWAKLYLCILGCMEWSGHNPVPPELWLLPNWTPFHPGRMWCHARMVYLPMGYLYGVRFVYKKAESDPLIKQLRHELYTKPYDSINWDITRHWVAPMDNYSPIPISMKTIQNMLAFYESFPLIQPLKNFLRKRGLAFCVDYMAAEDLQTNFIDIGPVNKVLNMLSAYSHAHEDLQHSTVMNHMIRVADYLWIAEDGMKMKGYNGCQSWDTTFAVQAIYEANLLDEFPDVSRKIWNYLERCQILSTEVSQSTPAYKYESAQYRRKYYRHISQGGWPFSTSAHGWPIADCTGEGLKGVLCLLQSKTIQQSLSDNSIKKIAAPRLYDAVNVLLSYQNEDGGFATYENNRGFGFYEALNPSEVFGDIMIDYSYVELSMGALTALAKFMRDHPEHRKDEIQHALDKGNTFLKSIQRADGSWYGSWACCFSYAAWFGIEGLIQCGEPYDSTCIRKACDFLLIHQRPNGGWGEDFSSCYDKDYAINGMEAYGDEGSCVVNTSWALMALAAASCDNIDAINRGVNYLLKRQLPSGDWPQEGITGVFNRSCGITYTSYRNVFPIWALGRCNAVYKGKLLLETYRSH